MCFNKQVLIGLGVVALGVLAVAPRLPGAVAPLLLLAACPLSMLFVMRAMYGQCQDCRKKAQRRDDTGLRRPHAAIRVGRWRRPRPGELRELQGEANRLKAKIQVRS